MTTQLASLERPLTDVGCLLFDLSIMMKQQTLRYKRYVHPADREGGVFIRHLINRVDAAYSALYDVNNNIKIYIAEMQSKRNKRRRRYRINRKQRSEEEQQEREYHEEMATVV